ncbi:acyltransferase [Actinosynnema pretiosum subsp. pretiosum]|uniref:Acyltransferase n=1 Tax=Actinosynnema pretiosum subsp. pretiosum TaxID=103721 RepID=A0AA45L1S2_9PSEU|nr:putative acyltransferase, putative [Actinosynnema pretiosum subsp. pretiosum]QUF01792.1 acyltransferase [Actinosynnema pretiosum subsp. pretiosum]
MQKADTQVTEQDAGGRQELPAVNGSPSAASPSAASRVPHINQLTGIRALAALWVLLFHFRPELIEAFGFLYPLIPLMNVGYLGVDLFFVLSGFILTYTHLDRMIVGWGPRKMIAFLWLRLSRIWPVMFTMLIVWGCYLAWLATTTNDGGYHYALQPGRFLAHVFLVQAWGTAHHDWNPIDWSLSAEWMAYIAFCFLVVLLAKFRALLSSRALIGLALLAVLPIVLVGIGFQDGSDLMWDGDKVVEGMVPLRVLTEFVGGAIVAVLVLRHGLTAKLPWFLRPTVVLPLILVVIYAICLYDPAVRVRFAVDWRINGHLMWGATETVVVVPLFLLLVGSLAVSGRDVTSRFLSTKVMVWGGKVSFALYLVHWLLLDLMRRLLTSWGYVDDPSSWGYRLLLIAALVLSVVGGWLLHRYVEEPCQRSMRKMLPRSIKV